MAETHFNITQNITSTTLDLINEHTTDQKNAITQSKMYDDLITNEVITAFYLYVSAILQGLISIAGVGMNLTNIIVQFRLGLSTANSVGVFALSVTDLLVTLLQLTICVCYLLDALIPENGMSFKIIGNFELGWLRYDLFFISGWITTLLSLERCCCVALPFAVKQTFTKLRITITVICVYSLYASLIVPFYVVQKLNWREVNYVDLNNATQTRYVLNFEYTQELVLLQTYIISIAVVALFFLCQIIILICSAIMIYALKISATSRRSLLTQTDSYTSRYSLSSIEIRLVSVILGLALIHTVCNLPRFTDHIMRYAMPEMAIGLYANLSGLLWAISDICGTINCSVSFCVYWTLSSSFKQCFWQMFRMKPLTMKGTKRF